MQISNLFCCFQENKQLQSQIQEKEHLMADMQIKLNIFEANQNQTYENNTPIGKKISSK